MPEQKPELQPIIIKKKVVHGGHHGGAWKVAYADFVTAMMALFIVLWLMNSKEEVQKAVGGYFRDPTGKSDKIGAYVKDKPVRPQDLGATIYHALGVPLDPRLTKDGVSKPLTTGQPILGLFG